MRLGQARQLRIEDTTIDHDGGNYIALEDLTSNELIHFYLSPPLTDTIFPIPSHY